SWPSSWRMVITPGRSRSSVPFGPFTVTCRSATVTSTPEGTGMGERPIRLIASPHVTEDLAADPDFASFTVGHEAPAGRQHGDAEPAEHPRDAVGFRVHPQAGLADAAQAGDGALALGRVLHVHGERAAGPAGVVLDAEALDVPLLLEDAGERFLLLRRRHA